MSRLNTVNLPWQLVAAILIALLSGLAQAQKDPDLKLSSEFEHFSVHHVIFNSTFVLPEVAQAAGIKRSKYESLLNISVFEQGKSGTVAAKLEGTATNLMQQQQVLQFKEIREQDAVYYLAPIRVASEELLRFDIRVLPLNSEQELRVNFSQTVYADK